MKSEKLTALTFIIVGCIGATVLGFIVWQASSPTRPTLDIAMHTTTSTTPAPTGSENPVQSPLDGADRDLNNQTLAAVDTADPYLPPNAFVSPRVRNTPTTTSPMSSNTSVSQPQKQSTTPGQDRTESGDNELGQADRDPIQPETTPPPVRDEPADSDNAPTPVPPTEPTDSGSPTDTVQPGETDTSESTDPTPTDFIEEPTLPLNPEQPVEPSVSESPTASTVDSATVTESLVD